jgi:hypothetical protein
VKQQDRKKDVVNEGFSRCPNLAVERGEAADEVAAQDQGEVGEEELSVIHPVRIPATKLSGG